MYITQSITPMGISLNNTRLNLNHLLINFNQNFIQAVGRVYKQKEDPSRPIRRSPSAKVQQRLQKVEIGRHSSYNSSFFYNTFQYNRGLNYLNLNYFETHHISRLKELFHIPRTYKPVYRYEIILRIKFQIGGKAC